MDDSIPRLIGLPDNPTRDTSFSEDRKLVTSRDGISEGQLEMLQQLNSAQVTEHPHLGSGDLVEPIPLNQINSNDLGKDILDPTLLEVLSLSASLLEVKVIAERTLGIVNEDHRKTHALELRVNELEGQIQNLLQLLARKKDKEMSPSRLPLPIRPGTHIDVSGDEGAADWN